VVAVAGLSPAKLTLTPFCCGLALSLAASLLACLIWPGVQSANAVPLTTQGRGAIDRGTLPAAQVDSPTENGRY